MKQKLFHLSKRKELPWYAAWGIRAAAILLALVVCGFVTTAMTGENPIAIYKTMWEGAFGTSRRIWNTLQYLALLLCVSLAVTPAFRMKFWNSAMKICCVSTIMRRTYMTKLLRKLYLR